MGKQGARTVQISFGMEWLIRLVLQMPKIIIDSRESRPLPFKATENFCGTEIKKLNVGDYSIEGYENHIAIERKSAQDLFQTLGKDHKRFEAELKRAANYDYFAIMVEAPWTNIYNKDFENAHYSQMRGDVILQICCTLRVKYGIDVIFVNTRAEAVSMIRMLFKAYLKSLETKPEIEHDNPMYYEVRRWKRKLWCNKKK
jgi:ERCC4-type nuclease